MTRATLYGVSVGPGDPELMTLRAVRAIREADVIAVPDKGFEDSLVLDIARDHLAGKRVLYCPTPMTRDEATLYAAHQATADRICAELDAGRSVAYLCLGDASIYGSFLPVGAIVRERGHETSTIAGVTSFSAAAAALGIGLCTGDEPLVIAPASSDDLDTLLDLPATKVLMKPGRAYDTLCQKLAEHGLEARTSVVANCGLAGERVCPSLGELEAPPGYLSVLIVRRA